MTYPFRRWLLPPCLVSLSSPTPTFLAPPSLNYCCFPRMCHGLLHPWVLVYTVLSACYVCAHHLSSWQMSPLTSTPTKHLSPGIPALILFSQTPSSMHLHTPPYSNYLIPQVPLSDCSLLELSPSRYVWNVSLSPAQMEHILSLNVCLDGWMDGRMGGWADGCGGLW